MDDQKPFDLLDLNSGSQFPKLSSGLWQSDYCEIADIIGLSGEDPALHRLEKGINVSI